MTAKLTGDYLLPAGEVLATANEDGILIEGAAWSSLTLDGRLEVSNTTNPFPVGAIRASADGLTVLPRTIAIGPTGSVTVVSTTQGYAFAISASGTFGQGIKVANFGVVEVRTMGESAGIATGSGGLENRGSITVSSPGSATGASIDRAAFVNSGAITVTGGSGALQGAIGVRFVGVETATFTNSGTIAVSRLAAPSVATGVAITGYTNFVNTGTISADVAIHLGRDGILSGDGRHSTITNSGTLRGEVFLNNTTAEPVHLRNFGKIEGAVTLNTGDDTYNGVNGVVTGVVRGEAGADSIVGGSGAETLSGGAGADTITDESGSNYLRGDDGNDSISGGAQFDDINGNIGNDTASGGDGDDWVVGGKDSDSLFGGTGGDLVYGNLGADTCEGGDGSDIVRGGQDNDSVSGGAGDDYVSGDKGDDTVAGGAGADLFHTFGDAGIDRVTDFSLAQGDRVLLDPGTQYTVAQSGADTVISMTGGGQMILVGVQMSTLTAGWIFGA